MSPATRWFRRTMVALVQADRPVPARSEDEIAAEVERNFGWNFAANLLDGAFFFLGMSFISSSTTVPLFISKLSSNPLPIGVAAAIAQSGWFLPQLFTANVVEQLPRKKPVVVNLGFFSERLPMWLLVVAALIAMSNPVLALIVFLIGYAWHTFGAGVVATSWQEMVARCFPVERRGRFLGTTTFVGTGMGAAGSALTVWLLDRFPFSTNFVAIFGIASLAILISWVFLALTREPLQSSDAPRQSNRAFLAKLPVIVREDDNYRRFLVARSLLALGGLGIGFVTVASLQRWQVPDGTVGIYTAANLIGQTVGNLLFGFLADRHGHKLSLELGAIAAAAAFALALFAPAAGWYYAVFFLLGVSTGAFIVSGILVVMEFSTPRRRPTYMGLTNTAVGVVSVVAPLLGAWLAGAGYNWVFAASLVVYLAALVAMRFWVREPRWAPKSDPS